MLGHCNGHARSPAAPWHLPGLMPSTAHKHDLSDHETVAMAIDIVAIMDMTVIAT